jgi:hydroxypyruvate isomerase
MNTAPKTTLSRRTVFKHLGAGAVALGAVGLTQRAEAKSSYKSKNGRIRQSVCWWCYKPMTVEQLADYAVQMGLESVELLQPEQLPVIQKKGLTCAMISSHGFVKGFAHKEEHDECIEILTDRINKAADAGLPNVITFSGYRRGLSTDEGMKNMVDGLKKIIGHAEKKKVNLVIEMLNSRVNINMKGHPDYFCDSMDMTADIVKQVGSERMKILFDIYHVQIMHGDVIRRIRQHKDVIAHYHTAGVPGRGELDETQETNYPAVLRAILETGYSGYVAQEFIPTWSDKASALRHAAMVCDV